MRIAFIGHKRIPSREGGIEIVVDELATRMVARGEQVVVYNRKGHNVAGEEFDNQSSTSDKPYMYRGVRSFPSRPSTPRDWPPSRPLSSPR